MTSTLMPTRINAPVDIKIGSHLRLRQYVDDDAPILFNLVDRNRANLRKRLTWVDRYYSVTDSELFIKWASEVARTNGAPTCGIWSDDVLVGTISFHEINRETMTTMFGYWIDESMQGRGIVSMAVQAMIEYAFTVLDIRRIEIVCAPDNASSQAIATKFGFARAAKTQVAIWKHDPTAQMVVYVKTRP